MAPPTLQKTATTARDYLRRTQQLHKLAKMHFGRRFTIAEFASFLIDTIRPTLSAASWRQYRSAVCYALECKGQVCPPLSTEVHDTLVRLRTTPPTESKVQTLRTSRKKAKRLPPDDLERIQRFVLSGRSPYRRALADFLSTSHLTGLRPCEWPWSQIRPCAEPGLQWELIVPCAKNTHGRAHGETRTLRFVTLAPESVQAISCWIEIARQADEAHAYQKLTATIGALMRRCGAKLFPRRKQRPTLYTGRHQAAARWKAYYVDAAPTLEAREDGLATVAALLGHATDESATHHYARPIRNGRSSGDTLVPLADPVEVARIRRQYARKLHSATLVGRPRSGP